MSQATADLFLAVPLAVVVTAAALVVLDKAVKRVRRPAAWRTRCRSEPAPAPAPAPPAVDVPAAAAPAAAAPPRLPVRSPVQRSSSDRMSEESRLGTPHALPVQPSAEGSRRRRRRRRSSRAGRRCCTATRAPARSCRRGSTPSTTTTGRRTTRCASPTARCATPRRRGSSRSARRPPTTEGQRCCRGGIVVVVRVVVAQRAATVGPGPPERSGGRRPAAPLRAPRERRAPRRRTRPRSTRTTRWRADTYLGRVYVVGNTRFFAALRASRGRAARLTADSPRGAARGSASALSADASQVPALALVAAQPTRSQMSALVTALDYRAALVRGEKGSLEHKSSGDALLDLFAKLVRGMPADRAQGWRREGEGVGGDAGRARRPRRPRVADAGDAQPRQGRARALLPIRRAPARRGGARHGAPRAALWVLQGLVRAPRSAVARLGDQGEDRRARQGAAPRRRGRARRRDAGRRSAEALAARQVGAPRGRCPRPQGEARLAHRDGDVRREQAGGAAQVPQARRQAECGPRHDRGADGGQPLGRDSVLGRRLALPAAPPQGVPQRGAQGDAVGGRGGDGQPAARRRRPRRRAPEPARAAHRQGRRQGEGARPARARRQVHGGAPRPLDARVRPDGRPVGGAQGRRRRGARGGGGGARRRRRRGGGRGGRGRPRFGGVAEGGAAEASTSASLCRSSTCRGR